MSIKMPARADRTRKGFTARVWLPNLKSNLEQRNSVTVGSSPRRTVRNLSSKRLTTPRLPSSHPFLARCRVCVCAPPSPPPFPPRTMHMHALLARSTGRQRRTSMSVALDCNPGPGQQPISSTVHYSAVAFAMAVAVAVPVGLQFHFRANHSHLGSLVQHRTSKKTLDRPAKKAQSQSQATTGRMQKKGRTTDHRAVPEHGQGSLTAICKAPSNPC